MPRLPLGRGTSFVLGSSEGTSKFRPAPFEFQIYGNRPSICALWTLTRRLFEQHRGGRKGLQTAVARLARIDLF